MKGLVPQNRKRDEGVCKGVSKQEKKSLKKMEFPLE